ncbi:15704_t:CDS:2 [Funneliformis geosporum]|uniref:15704_t:CDS:1 n=1 Tax=Funneliformis geosporum TaxID=1117311 RepID=A0A9W4X5I4_9GLOM|nr:15704_t:CDS:2 [Funneliformis geosporum]
MSSIKSLVPPKISVSGIAGASGSTAALSDFYSKLPKGPAPKIQSSGPLGRYYARYIATSSPAPILHAVLAISLTGYVINYHFNLKHHKQKEHH